MTAFLRRDHRSEALGSLNVLQDETICILLEYLDPRYIAHLSCVSIVMYILCNEEPLWMSMCLKKSKGSFEYKGSWKNTTLYIGVTQENTYRKPLHFGGNIFFFFNSMYLYKRFYRCNTSLDGFAFDDGNVERRREISLDEFSKDYDAKKPVLLSGLADSWPASKTWTIDQLSEKYGEVPFRISQRSPNKISMKFKDYISYMKLQRDEDPLYVFDDRVNLYKALYKAFFTSVVRVAGVKIILKGFNISCKMILDKENRPRYRWLIVGPERSGASWHVDPALTSAWNTLLFGRKRWALPPGKVPLGVAVQVNEDDGNVSIDTPSSLQWWLDYYPLLADEDKPIACTLLPGETIYVPSGWWHCILNLEPTVAITQNFVNKENFGFVCLDMAPGYQHKGVCRAGLLALDDGDSEEMEEEEETHDEDDNTLSYSDLTRKEKRVQEVCSFHDLTCRLLSKMKSFQLELAAILLSVFRLCVVPWDGKRIPDIFTSSNLDFDASMLNSEFPFGIWNKTLFEHRNQGKPAPGSFRSLSSQVWPRDDLTWSDAQNLASFLGQQLRNLHLLPYPPVTPPELLDVHEELKIPPEWKVFVDALCQKKKDVTSRLETGWLLRGARSDAALELQTHLTTIHLPMRNSPPDLVYWGNPIPRALMNKIDEYIPDEFFIDLLHVFKDTDVGNEIKPCTWIHSDVMDDNIHMGPYADGDGQHNSWRPSHILDFSDLSIGDPFYDLIPIYLDVFGGDTELFKKLLESYGIPLIRSKNGTVDSTRKKVLSPSYRTMCYCILHEENVLGAMFSIWDELRTAESWEQIDLTVWSLLNSY
ncbi:hypothetical protein HID58_047706 [Brassica napus]|uniref:JmjC domain-containing protein n=1 Tax=Brassica napus TaxID=3708 RepID=A0ABQ8B099_BRANA|nr:hypothetical protein HID58_047706 [Brassica napus]